MAGVVAMASVIEDFDTQPCKKSRKDTGGPAAKPITNYFSPVPKPVEKPFSPPRSNNIMSYFCRKAPSSKEQTCPPELSLENCQKPQAEEKQKKSEGKRQGSQKRSKKTDRVARELMPAESISADNDVECMIVEKAPESKDSAADLQSNPTVDVTESDQVQKKDSKSESALQTSELTPRDESKSAKTSRKLRKKKQNPSEAEKEAECDVSVKVSNDDTSCVKDSTVKISFEEFLRSQSKDEDDKSEDKAIITISEEKLTAQQMDNPKAEQHVDFLASPQQISPRTVTIQAEVHAISPNREEVKTVGKLASIFNQKRRSNSPVESRKSPLTDSGPKLSSPTVKLKSNVVLQEEDLELYVLDSDSAPKCSEAERKQFMAAFKQPSLDGTKSKLVKSQGKPKDVPDKTADAEDVIVQPKVEETPPEIKEASKKLTKKERIKASIICLEDLSTSSQNEIEKNKSPKALRSLNDVLGKAAGKDVKAAPGSKSASLGQEKSAQKSSAVISIFDDSSCEGSENSKDDGQFKARREFLKSGLPESFKKQIAKTVASKEAYSVSCSSFQLVTHTAQPPDEPKAESWSAQQPIGGKRKRSSNEGGETGKVAKKQKRSQSEDNVCTAAAESPQRESRTRRSQRSRQQEGEGVKKKSSLKPAPTLNEDDRVIVLDDVILVEDTRKKDSDWDGADEYGEDTLCNTMLIVGPTGVGKTAAVYACAQELGFKVFEVNASSQRSGRLILSQLKEATQSHQVDSQGRGPPKPSYFNNYGTSSGSGSLRPGSSPRKGNSPRRVVSSPRKNPQSPRGARKGGLAPVSLANFFKMNVGGFLQLLCLAENVRTDPADVRSLLRLNRCDIRQSLLQLQFWSISTDGRLSAETPKHSDSISTAKLECGSAVPSLPLCEKGCTESKLGPPEH
ncbi:hypothetical protein OJAV_G00077670 [Oryzias javanicus]|uniref:ATPase AAA-type core domain-containing protein n=1 Tax=Oryzias javanicus TaxID=123683 RepID=A0A437D2S4_ORYJA|nr:hypothetical protein OJAV_G00077670 [Oryzias javanicus]